VRRLGRVFRVVNLKKEFERLLMQECAGSRDFNTQSRLKGCRKECVQEVSKKIEFMEKFRRSRTSNSLEDKRREAAIESLREASQVGKQVNESRGETLLHFVDCIRKRGWSKSSKEIS
jgi:hypothetical protein